ncbi:MAG: type II toxin-antitoxin system MqsR family toxin [Gammaproteobacteria bacterium]
MKNNLNKPSYQLEHIKRVFQTVHTLRMTTSAKQTQYALGFSDQTVVDVIQKLTSEHFYKSMPPVSPKFTAWQDVYRPTYFGVALYIKFQINKNKELIVSFKEK